MDAYIMKSGGGDAGKDGLNIAYGNTPPADTDKLWVMCDEPVKVDMSNYFNYNGGAISEIINPLNEDIYNPKACTDGQDIYFLKGASSSSSYESPSTHLYKLNLRTGIVSDIYTIISASNFGRGASLCCKEGKLYVAYGGSSSYNSLLIIDLATLNGTTYTINSTGNTYVLDVIVEGNYLYLINYNSVNWSEYNEWRSSFNLIQVNLSTMITEKVISNTGTMANYYRLPNYAIGFNKIDNNCYLNIMGSIYKFDLDEGTMSLYWNTGESTSETNRQYYGTQQFNDKIIKIGTASSSSNFTIKIYDYINKTIETLPYEFSKKLFLPGMIVVDNRIIFFGGRSHVAPTNNRNVYGFNLDIELAHKTLMILFYALPSKWEAINSEDLTLKLTPIKVYLGNENNKAEKQYALLYNENTQQWEVI